MAPASGYCLLSYLILNSLPKCGARVMLYIIVSHQRGLLSGAPRPTPVEEGVLLPFQVQGLNCPSDQDYLSTFLFSLRAVHGRASLHQKLGRAAQSVESWMSTLQQRASLEWQTEITSECC